MRIGDRICIMQHGKGGAGWNANEIVSAPANDYVRSFFRNVDVSRVFKAADVARGDELIIFEPEGSWRQRLKGSMPAGRHSAC